MTELSSHVKLLLAFANTIDVDEGTDALPTAGHLTDWLREHGILSSTGRATRRDLALALELRNGVRDAMSRHHGGVESGVPTLDAVAQRLPLRISFTGKVPKLLPYEGSSASTSLALILAAIAEAHADHNWRRLKICGADDCRWAYFDTSKNQSRQWCSMRICGNRSKTRAYRARTR